MAKIKVRAKQKAFYNNSIVKMGDVIEIDGNGNIPKWAEYVGKPKAKTPNETKKEQEQQQLNIMQVEGKEENKQNNAQETSDEELTKIFDELLTKAIGLEIYYQGEGKPLAQQVEEIKELIAQKEQG